MWKAGKAAKMRIEEKRTKREDEAFERKFCTYRLRMIVMCAI